MPLYVMVEEAMRFVGAYGSADNLTDYTYPGVDLGAAGGTVVVLTTTRSASGTSSVTGCDIDSVPMTVDYAGVNGSSASAFRAANPGGVVTIATKGNTGFVRQGIGVWVLSGTRDYVTGVHDWGNAGSYSHTTGGIGTGDTLLFQGSSDQGDETMLSAGATQRAFREDADGYGHVSADNDTPDTPTQIVSGSSGGWRVTISGVYGPEA